MKRVVNCRGQALAESLVALLMLLPLWFAVVYFTAWNHADFQLRQLARQRIFEAATARASTTTRQTLLQSGRSMIVAPDELRVRVVPSGNASTAERVSAAAFDIAGGAGSGVLRWGAGRDAGSAWIRSEVIARLVPTGLLASPSALPVPELRRQLTLLSSDWSASGSRDITSRIASWTPTAALRTAAAPLRPVMPAIAQLEPSIRELCIGRIDPEVIPQDRLQGIARPQPARSRRC